ncbi:ribosome biogenesis GTPase YqeH [Effusibacillus pohliae]|uniref:ribosome biogenesis GTPase YqeH n=1 Tax=Effusibacillus pohliae TaxID=232270 RepID=UPI0003666F40|nr:ribosome biogenesis GTPase YqeH [Effusibacillus pohliae]
MDPALKICTGCGAPLQTEHPERPGYTVASALEREHPVCRRCFRIKHYNEVAPVAIHDDEFIRIVSEISTKRALVVKVVDLFDFSGSWIDNLRRYIGNNPVLLVANKVDVLPKQTNLDKVEQWLRKEVEKKGVLPEGIALVSASKGHRVEQVKTFIERYANERDVYVIGTANVGKSTLINRLIQMFGETGNVELTTSRYPGTTLSTVQLAIPNYKHMIVDTPGILTTHRLSDLVCPNCLKQIVPDRAINPRVYQLNSGQTLFVGGLARFDFVSGERQPFVCYFANQLGIHRTKLENADALYERHIGGLLTPPCADCGDHLRDLATHKLKIKQGPNVDIVISGLGWISVRGHACEVHLRVPSGVDVSVRRAII